MSIPTFIVHFLTLLAPAWGVALLLVPLSRLVYRHQPWRLSWWANLAASGLFGSAILLAGLVLGGEDGRVLTYFVLVLGMASLQWALLRPAPAGG
ncbi:hypothetical protein D8I35_00445 [Corticibacter populi]|uniref:Uncharacterized protein n=1 Tax=Corticibacter populi TaxID=1550736 RepID=A0A3M6QXF2_9BURK|nr:hypothetical protein [Corticibacter populi]RMX07654.1 hypothetical protein D8I35_00445 [Corticibacter populi]RZS30158.1 hypothetical protein EV687_3651 [Corticibacter populi]